MLWTVEKLTCGQEGCIINTRWPNRAECWREAQRCPKHYWGNERYHHKKIITKKCPCGCGRDE